MHFTKLITIIATAAVVSSAALPPMGLDYGIVPNDDKNHPPMDSKVAARLENPQWLEKELDSVPTDVPTNFGAPHHGEHGAE